MRKVISYMNEGERRHLQIIADLGLAAFSTGLMVEVLKFCLRAFPDKIDHILSWRGTQRIRIG
jgi:hypothetical protein